MDKGCRIVAHTTGRNKAHPEYGVEGIFVEFMNKAWRIPSDSLGRCPEEVEALLAECVDYQPSKHTGDRLMALWFAVEQGRKLMAFKNLGRAGGSGRGLLER
jgi:hypothetical protein